MRIALNGLELSKTAEGAMTVGDVLNELRAEIQRGRKIITEVCLDGQPLSKDSLRSVELSRPVSVVQRMDLRIEEAASLRALALAQAEQLTAQLQENCKPISRKFRIGDAISANRELSVCLDDLQLVAMGLDQSLRLIENPRTASLLQNQVTRVAKQLAPTLDNIYKAQAAADYVTVADEIEHELSEHLANWRDLLRTLQESVNATEQVG
jgi:hypothetical protein